MVMAIEYMSDSLVGPPQNPNLSGYTASGAAQRKEKILGSSVAVAGELRSSMTLVSPKSAKQARPSSEIRIFAYTELSAFVCKKI